MDGGDVARMVQQRDGLGVGRAEEPGLLDPARLKLRVDARQGRQEARQQFILAEREIFMVSFQVIAAVNDVVAAEVFRLEEVGVLHQRQEGEAGRFG